jgi:hypothetical protein
MKGHETAVAPIGGQKLQIILIVTVGHITIGVAGLQKTAVEGKMGRLEGWFHDIDLNLTLEPFPNTLLVTTWPPLMNWNAEGNTLGTVTTVWPVDMFTTAAKATFDQGLIERHSKLGAGIGKEGAGLSGLEITAGVRWGVKKL